MPTNIVTGLSTIPLDDQMVPGATYTFQFKCANYFCLTDISQRLQSEILTNAPGYVSSLLVQSPSTTSLYNVQFTYVADGSDVVSDVANELIAAMQAGGDSVTFIGAVMATIPEVTVGVSQAATVASGAIGTGIGSVLGNAVGGLAKGATSNLGFDVVIGVLLLALVAYFLLVSGAGAALSRRNA